MLERGRYGVEWTRPPEDERSSGFGWVVVAVVVLALASLAWTLVVRLRDRVTEEAAPSAVPSVSEPAAAPVPAAPSAPAVRSYSPEQAALSRRPQKVRNLLMRLEAAERALDIELAASTIEQLLALPGAPAADLENALLRRLGTLNMRRLFQARNPQWVTVVTVKAGAAASRIAVEHGSTFASMRKLNGKLLDKVLVGEKLYVLNHPRFNLVVRRRLKTADLQLNGKFFKRYDLSFLPGAKDGVYEWREIVLGLKPADRAELDMLLPKSASVLVAEM